MKDYANEYEFDEDQRVILYDVLRSVDIWFLKEIEARAEKKSKRDARGKTNGGHGGRGKKVLPSSEGS